MENKKLSFQNIKDKAPAALLAAIAGYGIFQVGEDYGEYKTYRQLEHRETSSLTDIFIQKACPQLAQTELAFGIIKPEEGIKSPVFSFVLEDISKDKGIFISSQNTHNDAHIILIDSPGGDVSQTNVFLQQAKSRSEKIITIVNGTAASAAFTIAISGSSSYRIMTPESRLMVHEATITDDEKSYQQSDLPFWSPKRLLIRNTVLETKILMKDASPSLSEDCIDALLRQKTDTYIPAIDALKLGLTDAIVSDPKMTDATALGTPAMVRKGDPREFVLAPGLKP